MTGRFCTTSFVFALLISGSATAITVTGDPSEHELLPGVHPDEISGFLHEGVARLRVTDGNGNIVFGTGALLKGGQYVLTAAHLLDLQEANPADFDVQGIQVIFQLDGTTQNIFVGPSNYEYHLDYKEYGDTIGGTNPGTFASGALAGYDLALIDLGDVYDTIPSLGISFPAYDVYRGNAESQNLIMVGYGRTGTGITGDDLPSGTKHWAENRFEIGRVSFGAGGRNGDAASIVGLKPEGDQ